MTSDQARPAAAGEAEGDAAVVGEGQSERAQHVDLLARGRGAPRPAALAAWSSDDDEAAERAGEAPGAGRVALTRDQADDDGRRATKRTITPIIGLRSRAKPPPPIGGRKRRKKLR